MNAVPRARGQRKKWILVIGAVLVAIAGVVAWQIGWAEIGNVELHDDLRDIAAQNGVNIGLNSPKTDEQVREDVVTSAAEHGIRLQPDQVQLQRIETPFHVRFDLAVNYARPVSLLLFSFDLHFNQTSAK